MKAISLVFGDQISAARIARDQPSSAFLAISSVRGPAAAARLRHWRQRLNISQKALAELASVPPGAVRRAESDPERVSFQQLNWICEALCDSFAESLGIPSDAHTTPQDKPARTGLKRAIGKSLGWSVHSPQAMKALWDLGFDMARQFQ